MQRIRTVDDAAQYLSSLIDREKMSASRPARTRLGLHPIRALLEAVGNPERELAIIHVAGSKGKGSVCLAGEAVLTALGERVGVFTSPHLEHWTERFRIGGCEVPGAEVARAVEALRPHVERLRRDCPDDSPSFFDATTAAALLMFAGAGVDRVLLEVGLGGRLDSTNAVFPQVTCITQIELEHTEILGDTLSQIAREKAGILKPGVPCVVGALAAPALKVVRERATATRSTLICEGLDFELATQPVEDRVDATRLGYREPDGLDFAVDLPLVSGHLARNAGLAVACVRALREHGDAAIEESARAGLAGLDLPGRVEVAGRDPWVVIDSAHTGASARALAAALRSLGIGGVELILSVSRDKSVPEILAPLVPCAARVTVTSADPIRSLPAAHLARAVRDQMPGVELRIESEPRDAVRAALASAGPSGAVVVAGSVYLAGIARSLVREAPECAPADPPQ